MPIFIRGGAIIPTRLSADGSAKNIQQLDEDGDPFVFDIWPGAECSQSGCYFDDGGVTRDAETQGTYTLLALSQSQDTSAWNVTLKLSYSQYALPEYLYVHLRGTELGAVTDSANNAYAQVQSLSDLYSEQAAAYYFDGSTKEERIKIPTAGLTEAGSALTVTKANTTSYSPRLLMF